MARELLNTARDNDRELEAHLDNDLGSVLRALGDYRRALVYGQKALVIRKEVLGERHPDTAMSMNNIGMHYVKMGRLGQGLTFIEEALEITKELLGELHPKTLGVLNNLADALYKANRKQPAYQLLDQILHKLPKDHPRYRGIKRHREELLMKGVPGFRPLMYGKKSKKKRK